MKKRAGFKATYRHGAGRFRVIFALEGDRVGRGVVAGEEAG